MGDACWPWVMLALRDACCGLQSDRSLRVWIVDVLLMAVCGCYCVSSDGIYTRMPCHRSPADSEASSAPPHHLGHCASSVLSASSDAPAFTVSMVPYLPSPSPSPSPSPPPVPPAPVPRWVDGGPGLSPYTHTITHGIEAFEIPLADCPPSYYGALPSRSGPLVNSLSSGALRGLADAAQDSTPAPPGPVTRRLVRPVWIPGSAWPPPSGPAGEQVRRSYRRVLAPPGTRDPVAFEEVIAVHPRTVTFHPVLAKPRDGAPDARCPRTPTIPSRSAPWVGGIVDDRGATHTIPPCLLLFHPSMRLLYHPTPTPTNRHRHHPAAQYGRVVEVTVPPDRYHPIMRAVLEYNSRPSHHGPHAPYLCAPLPRGVVERTAAAVTIQGLARGYLCRKARKGDLLEEVVEHRARLTIQAWWRAMLARYRAGLLWRVAGIVNGIVLPQRTLHTWISAQTHLGAPCVARVALQFLVDEAVYQALFKPNYYPYLHFLPEHHLDFAFHNMSIAIHQLRKAARSRRPGLLPSLSSSSLLLSPPQHHHRGTTALSRSANAAASQLPGASPPRLARSTTSIKQQTAAARAAARASLPGFRPPPLGRSVSQLSAPPPTPVTTDPAAQQHPPLLVRSVSSVKSDRSGASATRGGLTRRSASRASARSGGSRERHPPPSSRPGAQGTKTQGDPGDAPPAAALPPVHPPENSGGKDAEALATSALEPVVLIPPGSSRSQPHHHSSHPASATPPRHPRPATAHASPKRGAHSHGGPAPAHTTPPKPRRPASALPASPPGRLVAAPPPPQAPLPHAPTAASEPMDTWAAPRPASPLLRHASSGVLEPAARPVVTSPPGADDSSLLAPSPPPPRLPPAGLTAPDATSPTAAPPPPCTAPGPPAPAPPPAHAPSPAHAPPAPKTAAVGRSADGSALWSPPAMPRPTSAHSHHSSTQRAHPRTPQQAVTTPPRPVRAPPAVTTPPLAAGGTSPYVAHHHARHRPLAATRPGLLDAAAAADLVMPTAGLGDTHGADGLAQPQPPPPELHQEQPLSSTHPSPAALAAPGPNPNPNPVGSHPHPRLLSAVFTPDELLQPAASPAPHNQPPPPPPEHVVVRCPPGLFDSVLPLAGGLLCPLEGMQVVEGAPAALPLFPRAKGNAFRYGPRDLVTRGVIATSLVDTKQDAAALGLGKMFLLREPFRFYAAPRFFRVFKFRSVREARLRAALLVITTYDMGPNARRMVLPHSGEALLTLIRLRQNEMVDTASPCLPVPPTRSSFTPLPTIPAHSRVEAAILLQRLWRGFHTRRTMPPYIRNRLNKLTIARRVIAPLTNRGEEDGAAAATQRTAKGSPSLLTFERRPSLPQAVDALPLSDRPQPEGDDPQVTSVLRVVTAPLGPAAPFPPPRPATRSPTASHSAPLPPRCPAPLVPAARPLVPGAPQPAPAIPGRAEDRAIREDARRVAWEAAQRISEQREATRVAKRNAGALRRSHERAIGAMAALVKAAEATACANEAVRASTAAEAARTRTAASAAACGPAVPLPALRPDSVRLAFRPWSSTPTLAVRSTTPGSGTMTTNSHLNPLRASQQAAVQAAEGTGVLAFKMRRMQESDQAAEDREIARRTLLARTARDKAAVMAALRQKREDAEAERAISRQSRRSQPPKPDRVFAASFMARQNAIATQVWTSEAARRRELVHQSTLAHTRQMKEQADNAKQVMRALKEERFELVRRQYRETNRELAVQLAEAALESSRETERIDIYRHQPLGCHPKIIPDLVEV
ncbi:hypothetical protein PAPYR_8089 [Paratrimastix pyriformis]|uniref:Uncharacterized protein n=1 Tax=Paratrimastix pyriformis TaxID=342808 RepID=A0ABQ8UBE9_9EUKA|nr:hypothetical protein PAPYR_8089 [Paratrimastix pyriformis]